MALFGTAGVFHLLTPGRLVGILPPWVPWPEAMVAISGVAELAGAIGLASPRTRAAASRGFIALLVAVFPANVQMLINAHHAHASSWWLIALWIRLPLQPLLIWLIWRVR